MLGWPRTHCVSEDNPSVLILSVPEQLGLQAYAPVPGFYSPELRLGVSCILGKHPTNRATYSAPKSYFWELNTSEVPKICQLKRLQS